ncbi:extracellular solute-binding protein [Caldicoprobacter algeriensis]|uniref:extracellular solute-binding protein n=1 Tax=Caldicoprobacter algeriensis TaxID=699281 RepID=UPI00207A0233|nr:extracellular solute-binding protein [Caldicoprobacter algeriensis]MCM8901805.1 extracellular solute-binding protein [Caldicoprobacter algeriensis]
MIKKLIAVVLVCMLALVSVACSSGSKTPSSDANENTSSNNESESTPSENGSSEGESSGDPAFMKFPKPVDVHIGMSVSPVDKTLPPGDSAQDNQYTRYLRENFNINVIVDWTAAEGENYNQKVSLAIASGDLPDGLVVNDRTYMVRAAKSGLLYDITDLFEKYASKQVKEIMASTQGRAMENASYNGRMVSLPNITVDTDGIYVMMIRKDWLDKLNLPVPKTLSDIEKTAKAFIENKMAGEHTIGIVGPDKNGRPYSTFLRSSNNRFGFDPVFQAMDAYPGYWLDDGTGKVVYGTLTENTKKTLELLARWYKEGIIDPELGTRDSSAEVVNANQAGIFFGPWWSIGYGNGDSFKNDPNANWQAYPVYSDDGKWNVRMKTVGTMYTLISKKASEDVAKAIIIMNNVLVRDEGIFDTSVAISWYPLRNVMAPADECEYEYKELWKILRGEADPEDYNIPGNPYKLMYSDAKAIKNVVKPADPNSEMLNVQDFDQTDFGKFQRFYSLLIGNRPYATITPDKKVYSVTYNQTETMERKWANLQKLEDEAILKIILGQEPISSFDEFVEKWKAQGGDEITAEVQAEYDKKNK